MNAGAFSVSVYIVNTYNILLHEFFSHSLTCFPVGDAEFLLLSKIKKNLTIQVWIITVDARISDTATTGKQGTQ